MTSSIIQLHVAPHEFATFIGEVATDLRLQSVLLRFQPKFICEMVPNPLRLAEFMDLKEGQEVVLLLRAPDLTANNQLEFYDKNPERISFDFGRWLPQGLRQSSMGYKTEDEATIAIGKEIAKRLKKITKAGVRVTNPKTGESAFAKTFRYTKGALVLEQSGVQMLPNGGNLVKLGE